MPSYDVPEGGVVNKSGAKKEKSLSPGAHFLTTLFSTNVSNLTAISTPSDEP